MKKLLPLVLLSAAAFYSGSVAAAHSQQPGADTNGAPDYSVYKDSREKGGYILQEADSTMQCIPFKTLE